VSDRIRRLLPRSKRVRIGLAALALLIVGVALGGYEYERHRTGNIYHPHARFIPEPTATVPAKAPDTFSWPFYGYSKEHTRFFPASSSLHAPFKQLWVNNANTLLEFPPVMSGDHIFQLGDDGVLRALNKLTGHSFWKRSIGRLSASSPAVVGNTVYATVLSGASGQTGRVVALNYATGAIRWSRALPSASESSPLVDDGRVFFGSQNGTVYALNASDGSVIWTYHAAGAVKASPTLSGGVLYFGDYSGHLQAVGERAGRRLWISSSGGALLGNGTFYSTAAVFYGRVFLGNTDGRVYAYDAFTGKLDWAVQTGAFVYASPAVTNAPGLGPTIYLGSYDGTFYALNARSGRIDWKFNAHGRISGSATIIGRTVYLADLGSHHTYGLGVSTGRVTFQLATGSFDPVISDGKNIYLTGQSGLYAFTPRQAAAAPTPVATRKTPRASAHARAKSAHARRSSRTHAPRRKSSQRARR
jgi:outer membrane protein assembly factor BamB